MPDAELMLSAEIENLAEEITRYLQAHRGVADTLEGVIHWWLLRQRLQEEQHKVQRAMDYLCAKGVVAVRELPSGELLYTATELAVGRCRLN